MKKKITILANDDLLNGPSLAQFRFAKSLAKKGFKVELLIAKRYYKYDLKRFENKDIKLIDLNTNRTLFLIIPLFKYFIQHKPFVIFSAGDHLNLITIISALLSFTSCKLSLSSRVTPYDTYKNKNKIEFKSNTNKNSKFLFILFKILNWRADVLTCVSKDMVKQYQEIFGKTKHECVYNIVRDDDVLKLKNEDITDQWIIKNKPPYIIAAGRLAIWKGFDDLINAYSLIKNKIPHKLIILGDGEEKQNLKKLIKEKNLEEYIFMPGYVSNPLKYFEISDIFVLSSLSEGMPNVMIEAMMCGCTPVSTNCMTGPSEIIKDNEYGYLSPIKDHKTLAENILNAVKKPISKKKLDEVVSKFDANLVIKKHFNLLKIKI